MDAKQDVWRAISALMGNGNGVVEVPNQPGYVYIRIGDGDLGQAFNNRCPLADNLAIYVGYDPVTDPERRIFQVLSVRMTDYANAGNTIYANVANHHATHEFGGGDDVYVDWRRLLGFRVGRPAAFTVTVDQGVIMRAGAWAAITSQTVNLAASQPGGVNSARYTLISLDAAGTVTMADCAIVSAALLDISDCPAPAASEIPLAAVRLYSTQTQISDVPGTPDIIDLRFPQTYMAGGSNIFGAGTQYQLAIWTNASTIAGLGALGTSGSVLRSAGAGANPAWSTFYLSGTAGGTTNFAVTNTKTLTLTATDSYNLTVPATGTAALGTGAADTLTKWSATNVLTNIANAAGYLKNDGAGGFSYVATAPPSAHNVLDSTYHCDVLTGAITRGDLLYGNATPKIARLPLGGAAGSVVTRDANDVLWSAFYFAGSAARTYTFPDYNISWPAADAHGYLHSDGAGTLTWDAGAIAAHAIDGADHTVAGRTAGQVLIATAAATFGWSGFLLFGTSGGMTNLDVANTKTLTLTTAQDLTLTFSTGLAGLFSINWGGAFTQNMYGGALDLDGRSLSLLNGDIQLDTAAGGGLRSIIIPSDGTLVLGTGTQFQLAVWNGVNSIAGLGGLGTSGAVLQSAGAGANPGWSTFYLAGTAAQTYTFPAAGGTVAMLNAANVFTANQTISSAAPSFIMTDTTGGAKSLTIAVDANAVNLRESAGAASSLLVLDLANNWVGIQVAPTAILDLSGSSQTTPGINDRVVGNSLEFGHPNSAGYACTIGSTIPNAYPFLAFNAEASPTGNANYFRTRGKAGVAIKGDLAGGLTIGRFTNASADSQTMTSDITLSSAGAVGTGGTLTVTGAFGCNSKAAQTAYASGGALAAYAAGTNGLDTEPHMSALHALVVKIRAALVANGIMS